MLPNKVIKLPFYRLEIDMRIVGLTRLGRTPLPKVNVLPRATLNYVIYARQPSAL